MKSDNMGEIRFGGSLFLFLLFAKHGSQLISAPNIQEAYLPYLND